MQNEDEGYMREALALAARGYTSPNPMVGAVVVRDGEVVGRGFHPRAGDPHAEVYALTEAGDKARGATLYVTLEPCSHLGKTPPCAPLVARAGIRRVCAAMEDPNPMVAGAGLRLLAQQGIEVRVGTLEAEARQLNTAFVKHITTGMPFVHLKLAMTLDGKTATSAGRSRWITGPEARRWVHQQRQQTDAVMVGAGTVLADDPELTVRLAQPAGSDPMREPMRVVVAGRRPLPDQAKVFGSGRGTLIARTQASPAPRACCEALTLPETDGGVDLAALMGELGRRNVTSVLVEGGATLSASLVRAQLVDRLSMFVAPKLFGGLDAPGPFGNLCVLEPDDACSIEHLQVTWVGADLLLEGDIAH